MFFPTMILLTIIVFAILRVIPGDPALDVADRDVAMAGPYQGRRRMTLTFPAIDRAVERMWVVTGASKAAMLARLRAGDDTIPAGRVTRRDSTVFADEAAVCAASD